MADENNYHEGLPNTQEGQETYQLVPMTEMDYPYFRECYERIDYSVFLNEKGPLFVRTLMHKAISKVIITRPEFLEKIKNPNHALYFFKNDQGQIKGFVHIIFEEFYCNIYEFAVFEKHKGLGTLMYNEILKIIEEEKLNRGFRKIMLVCSFKGAQIFWQKMGFKPQPNDVFFKRI